MKNIHGLKGIAISHTVQYWNSIHVAINNMLNSNEGISRLEFSNDSLCMCVSECLGVYVSMGVYTCVYARECVD